MEKTVLPRKLEGCGDLTSSTRESAYVSDGVEAMDAKLAEASHKKLQWGTKIVAVGCRVVWMNT